jgi:hypothetical protein
MSESVHPFRNQDLAARKRALERDIALKVDGRPTVDANGTPTSKPRLFKYDSLGALECEIAPDHGDKTAEEAGLP